MNARSSSDIVVVWDVGVVIVCIWHSDTTQITKLNKYLYFIVQKDKRIRHKQLDSLLQ
jgi:hypothetical protein